MQTATTASSRKYDLDWMRVLAFAILIFTHSGLTFTSPNWFITSESTSDPLKNAMKFPALWRIPLLFMISGAAVQFAMRKFPANVFLKKRISRIFIPFVFVWLIFNPPVGYIANLFRGEVSTNYFEFLIDAFSNLDFSRSNSSYWIHLWYLVYLLVYTLAALPFFIYLIDELNDNAIKRVIEFLSKNYNFLLLSVPPAIIHIVLHPSWPRTNNLYADWAYLLFNFIFFLYGFVIYRYNRLLKSISIARNLNLVLGILTSLVYLVIDRRFQFEDYSVLGSVLLFIKAMSTTTWILCFIGYADKYLNFNHRYLKYANEAVYPVFVMHILFQIIISYFVVRLDFGVFIQFILIFVGTLLCSVLFYEFCIKHFRVMRVLFGLNPKPVKRK